MRAVRQDRFGGPEVLRSVEVDVPSPAPTEVLVRMIAAGVNPVDWKVREGAMELPLPLTLGWDVAGIVEEVGWGVTRFAPGDRVFGMPRFPQPANGYAEFVTSPSRQLAKTPAHLTDIEAATLGLSGLTAWQLLVEYARVGAGDRVVVTAAAGGVGHLAVQIAKAFGAYVIASARSDKHEFVEQLGADEIIDYTLTSVPDAVDKVDLVMDAIGGPAAHDWIRCINEGGALLLVTGYTEEVSRAARASGVRFGSLLVEPDRAGLDGLVALSDRRGLRPVVSHQFALGDAAEAHRLGEQGRTTGKIALIV